MNHFLHPHLAQTAALIMRINHQKTSNPSFSPLDSGGKYMYFMYWQWYFILPFLRELLVFNFFISFYFSASRVWL